MNYNDTLFCTYTINSFHVDPKGRARLTALANFLQETAYKHAHSLGLGFQHLAQNNSAWVLSRLRIQVSEYPKWDNEITIETWPCGIEKLFARRDFRIMNKRGDTIGKASTSWLMVNTQTHRPIRIQPDFIKFKTRTDGIFDSSIEKINVDEELFKLSEHKVKYSDLDIVEHVNNVKFVEWCIDALDPDLIMNKSISDFTINFISEARIGDQVEIHSSHMKDNAILLAGFKTSALKESFIAKVVISD